MIHRSTIINLSLRWLSVVALLVLSVALLAQPAIPAKSNQLVNDYAGLLTSAQQAQLTQALNDFARETSTQVAVVTEASLEGQDVFDRSLAIAAGWGIGGSETKDNGALIYVARDDRKIYIQTGYGLEGSLNDARAGRIIRNIMRPAFRQGDYYAGIAGATQAIMDYVRGDYTADPVPEASGGGGIPPIFVFIFIFIIFMLLSRYGNRHDDDDDDDGGYWRNGKYDKNDPRRRRRNRGGGFIWLPGGFGGGGGGGGFGGLGGGGGGGGFGGFGGGGFGGGGAGGGW